MRAELQEILKDLTNKRSSQVKADLTEKGYVVGPLEGNTLTVSKDGQVAVIAYELTDDLEMIWTMCGSSDEQIAA